jgi:CheY-like chemotaxis protein
VALPSGNLRLAGGEKPVSVVLLDLKLSMVDGLEVLKRIKADLDLKKVPVVMLTSSHEEQDLVRSYNSGVSAHVGKPVGFESFVEAIKEVGLFWGVISQPPKSAQWGR